MCTGPCKTTKATLTSQLNFTWEVQCRREKTPKQICYFRGQHPSGGNEQHVGSRWMEQCRNRSVSPGGVTEVSITGNGSRLQRSGHWRGCCLLWGKIPYIRCPGALRHSDCAWHPSTHRAATLGHSSGAVSGSIANPRNYRIRCQTLSPVKYYPNNETEKQTMAVWIF